MTEDPRFQIFVHPKAPEVFYSTVGAAEIWRDDPFDVEMIHQPAREVFRQLIFQARNIPSPGRILLVKGESGAGKTHLLRYFRNFTHNENIGYFGYLQMTSPAPDYGRYILSHFLDSMNQPYCQPDEFTGLMRLSNSLAEIPAGMRRWYVSSGAKRARIGEALRNWGGLLNSKLLAKLVSMAAKAVSSDKRFADINPNVAAALLYLQTQDPKIKHIVLHYLRGEPLSAFQQEEVQLLPPALGLDALQILRELAKIMWAAREEVLVLAVDQLEGLLYLENKEQRIVSALSALVDLSAAIPSSLIIISCLEDFWTEIRKLLTASLEAKIQTPPSPVVIHGSLGTEQEITSLVGKRLEFLFENAGIECIENDRTYPIPGPELARYINFKARHILNACKRFQDEARRSQILPNSLDMGADEAIKEEVENLEAFEAGWIRFMDERKAPTLESENDLARLLTSVLPRCYEETGISNSIEAACIGSFIEVNGGPESLSIGVCNKRPHFGHLQNQIQKFEDQAKGGKAVVVRTTEFPRNPHSQTAVYIGDFIARGNRRAVVEDTEIKAMAVYTEFAGLHRQNAVFELWRKKFHPLTRYASIQRIIGKEDFETALLTRIEEAKRDQADTGLKDVDPEVHEPEPEPVETTGENGELRVGLTDPGGAVANVELSALKRHAAFLGGTGSGKTTAALNIIEQLLIQKIPVILVDRKGDLSRYADPVAWNDPAPDQEMEKRREQLRKSADVKLFTPGHPDGRTLSVSIVPDGSHLLPRFDRELLSGYACAALADIMGLKNSIRDKAARAILQKAIFLLTEINDPEEVTLQEIIDLVAEKDARLVNLVGRLDEKNFDHLAQVLEVMRASRERLFSGQGAKLSANLLLGKGDHAEPEKTRLSIISTKFIGDNLDMDFFIAQLLLELNRWTSRNPSDRLQAVIMFDEADIYLPATRKPATKGPMEDLLKRARSAGLGIFLATQSPGDFDYRCKENVQSWFIGRVKENTALEKIKPMMGKRQSTALERIPNQTVGQFVFVREQSVEWIKSGRSAIETEQLSEQRILELAGGGVG